MNKMTKRSLSLILACMMLLTMLPLGAAAATTDSMWFTTGILSDTSGTYPSEDLAENYALQENGENNFSIVADNVKYHRNGQGAMGYWVGVAAVAPARATQMKFAFSTESSELNFDTAVATTQLEDRVAVVDGVAYDGVALYVDASKTDKAWCAVQWLDSNNAVITADNQVDETGSAVTYYSFDLSKVTCDYAVEAVNSQGVATYYPSLETAVSQCDKDSQLNLLKDISVSRKITLGVNMTLNGNNHTITGVSDDASVYFEITGNTVTVKDLKVKDFGGAAATVGQWGLFKVPADSQTASFTATNVTASNFNRAAFDIRAGQFTIGSCNIDCANTSTDKLTKGVLAENTTGTITNTTITNAQTTFEDWNTNAIETWGNSTLTVDNCVLGTTGGKVVNGISMNAGTGTSSVTVSETSIVAQTRIFKLTPDANQTGTATLTAESGDYTGTFKINQGNVEGKGCSIVVKGGNYTADPTEYLHTGLAAVESSKEGFVYTVAAKSDTAAEVAPAGKADVAPVPSTIEGADKTLADAVKTALDTTSPTVTGDGMQAAAATEAQKNTVIVTETVVSDLNAAAENSAATVSNTKIVLQPYMEISIVGADDANTTITLDITPKYRTVATTAPDNIVLTGTGINAIQIGTSKDLTINKPVTVTVPLTSAFTDGNAFITHEKGQQTFVYKGTISSNVLTFINPHGFSNFTISKTDSAKVYIGDIGYVSLQDAVDEVKDGEKITLTAAAASETATVSRTIAFDLDTTNCSGYNISNLTAGNNTTLTTETVSENVTRFTFVYSTPGGGEGGTEEPAVPFTDVKEGDWFYDAVVYAYENNLMQGTSGTAFSPNVKMNRAMLVTILYRLEGEPAVSGDVSFTDVPDAYYTEAVAWAASNGLVEGFENNTFKPTQNITREQFATILYRYAAFKKTDTTVSGNLSGFTDAASTSTWAKDAMTWAVDNGIIQGVTTTTLAPQNTATRAQGAAMLMRFIENL